MNIHEYQAKKILADYGVKIPAGQVAYTPKEALAVAGNISKSGPWVLKAQIQSGARQSGYFLEKEAGEEGGIRKVTDKRRIAAQAQQMLGKTLVTIQTGAAGKRVNKIYIEAFQKGIFRNQNPHGVLNDRIIGWHFPKSFWQNSHLNRSTSANLLCGYSM